MQVDKFSRGLVVSSARAAISLAVMFPVVVSAADLKKTDNSDALNLTSSWLAGTVPGAADVAWWDSTVTGANSTLLGANLSWSGIKLTNPGGAVAIGAGNTLTLGTSGIDMSNAGQNLTISSGLTLGAGGQTWNVASGRTLTLNTGAFTRSAGASLLIDRSTNTGTVAATPALTNSIVPWLAVRSSGTAANNSANGYTFATVTSGNVVAYTGATAAATNGSVYGNIPAGGTGLLNYDVSATTAAATGSNRNVNSIRYTGSGLTQIGNTANADLLTINAIMNSGTGTFTIGTNNNVANDRYFNVVIGATSELVLAPMTANIAILGAIKNNGANASAVTVAGVQTMLLNGTVAAQSASAYTGATNITAGTLQVAGAAAINTTSGINVNGSNAKYLHTSSVASTRNLTLTRGTVDGTGSIGATTVADVGSNIVTNGNGGTTILTISALTFNGDATLNLNRASGAVGVAVTNALTTTPANGQVVVNVNGAFVNGLNNLVSYGSLSGAIGDFTLGTVTGTGPRQAVGSLQLNGNNLALNINGDTPYWSGLVNGQWTTTAVGGAQNWKLESNNAGTEFLASDQVVFDDRGSANTAIAINDANVSPVSTSFAGSLNYSIASTGAFGIASGTIAKAGSGTLSILNNNSTTGTLTISGGTVQIGNGTIDGSVGGAIVNNANLTFNVAGTPSAGNAISGTGSVTKSGAGTLTLTNNVTHSGGLNVNNGTLALGGTSGFGSGAVVVATGASLNILNASTVATGQTVSGGGSITTTGSLTINGDFSGFTGTYTHNNTTASTGLNSATATSKNAAYVIASSQGSAQGMVVAGTGNYTLELGSLSGVANSLIRGGNSATGTTTLQIGNLNTSTTFAGTIANGVTKSISVTKVGTGTLILSGTNSYSAGTLISAGTLQIGDGSTTGTLGGGTITTDASLVFKRSDALTVTNYINGSGTLTQSGTGTLSLTNGNAYTGLTYINAGTLNINGQWALGGGIYGGLTFGGGTLQYANPFPGTNGSGDISVSQDINALPIAAKPVTFSSTAKIDTNGNNVTYSNSVGNAGAGGLTKQGLGRLTLQGAANNYSGATLVSAGTLTLANSGALTATSSVTVDSGATLNNNGSITTTAVTVNGTLSGSGSISGNTVVNGTLAPGNSAGRLSWTSGNLSLGDGIPASGAAATSNFEIIAGVNDAVELSASGILVYDGTLNVDFVDGNPSAPASYTLFNFTSGNSLSDFDAISIAFAGLQQGSLTNSLGVWTSTFGSILFTYTSSTGVLNLSASAVPEPLTAMGVLLLTSRVLGRRSRDAVC